MDTTSLDDGIIAAIRMHLTPWRGAGLRVVIRPCRGHEKCPLCSTLFGYKNSYTCPTHKTLPYKVYLDITGLKKSRYSQDRLRIFESGGNPLQLIGALALKEEIALKISNDTFSPQRYQDGGKKLLFKYYKLKYLAKMKERNGYPQGSDGWLSNSAYDDIVKYFRNYMYLFDSYLLPDMTKRTIINKLDGLKGKMAIMQAIP